MKKEERERAKERESSDLAKTRKYKVVSKTQQDRMRKDQEKKEGRIQREWKKLEKNRASLCHHPPLLSLIHI